MTAGSLRRSPELTAEGLAALGPRNSCDVEPIHRCGAIQPHGFLLAVEPTGLTVVAASANTAHHLGLPRRTAEVAADVLGARLPDLLGAQAAGTVILDALSTNPHEGLPSRVTLRPGLRADRDRRGSAEERAVGYDLVAHRSGRLIVIELQPADEAEGTGSAAFYQHQRTVMQQLAGVDDVRRVCEIAALELRSMTGYDAVRIYRFDADAHGCVTAESCAPGIPAYLGLHFPAGDIPRQARALYLRNWIRVIGDVDYRPVPILTMPGLQAADLDLSMSVLRSVSPVHLQYLRNMGVIGSMSVSLVVENQLWGLITCHHYSPRPVSYLSRLACEAIGQFVSVRLRACEAAAEQAESDALAHPTSQVVTAMVAGRTAVLGAGDAAEPLLGMVAADGAVIELDGARATVGAVPGPAAVDRLVTGLASLVGQESTVFATDQLSSVLSLEPPLGDPSPAGALYLPISGRVRGFVLWLRREQEHTVRWAGNTDVTLALPEPPPAPAPAPAPASTPAPLSTPMSTPSSASTPGFGPRASFAEWREERRGSSAPWRPAQLAAARRLGDAIPDVLLHRSQSNLVRFAMHDPLTGLPNRRLLEDRLDQLLTTLDLRSLSLAPDPRARTASPPRPARPVAGLLLVVLEGLVPRVDHGEDGVDAELLTMVAERIRAAVRPGDAAARMSGDEFVVLLPGADAGDTRRIAEDVVAELHHWFGRTGRSLTLTVGGTVVVPGTAATDALRQADAALYHARLAGRDQVSVYDASTGTTSGGVRYREKELRQAASSGQLLLHFLPRMRLAAAPDADPVGFEAAPRWHHPTMGLLTPDRYLAPETAPALIPELDDAAVAAVVEQLRSMPGGQTMSVNVSPGSLTSPGFVARTLDRLAAAGLGTDRLCLELTEDRLREDPATVVPVLRELSAAGVALAIDDYGAGGSSLAVLRTLPELVLKISAGLVRGVLEHREDRALVTSVVQLARSLGWRSVATGVGSPRVLAAVGELGVDLAQGDLFATPLPALPLELTPEQRTRPPSVLNV